MGRYDQITHYLFTPVKYKPTITEKFKLTYLQNGKTLSDGLYSFSSIYFEESIADLHIPPFYIYIQKNDIGDLQNQEICYEFGKQLWQQLNECISEEMEG